MQGQTGVAEAVLSAIETARTVRKFAPDPVPPDLVVRLLEVACAAPSPRNTQPWRFVVVHDAAVRHELGEALAPRVREIEAAMSALTDERQRRLFEAGASLVRSLADAPVVVFVCGFPVTLEPPHDNDEVLLSALFTAAQNLRVAASAFGLGTAFTNLHVHAEKRVRAILKIPSDVRIAATIPMGWPARAGGKVRRRPVAEVIHWNGWPEAVTQ